MDSRFVEIPFIPALVDMDDVMPDDGKLLSPDEIAKVKNRIAELGNRDGRYSKKDLGSRFSVSKIGDKYYAIYKGAKHEKLIGAGSFGSVKFVQNLDDGTWAVIKTIRKKSDSSDEDHEKTISRERESLKDVGHFIGHWQRKSKKNNVTQDEVVMRLAPGTTVAKLIQNRDMSPVKWLDLAIGIMAEAQKMYQQGSLHRDIKPANMLADPLINSVTLIDFGLSRKYNPDTGEYVGSYGGSPKYMAPEISKHDKKKRSFNEVTEVYALGVTLAELFHLHIKHHVVEKEMASVKQIPNRVLLDELCHLINTMIHKKPNKRPRMSTVIEKLRALRTNELDLVSKVNSLVFLNVDKFASLSPEQKLLLLVALKTADEVQLCMSPNPWSMEMLMVIRHELESQGISVSTRGIILRHTNDFEKTVAELKEYAAERGAHQQVIYNSYYLRTEIGMNENATFNLQRSIDSLEVSKEHKDIALKNIDAQIERMNSKNLNDKRLQFLREFKFKLQNGFIKTYRQLFTAMHDLEENMLANESPSLPRTIARKFGLSSTANTAVRQSISEIIDDAHGRKSPPKK